MAPATFSVTKTADDGTANTLRWAIQQSNVTAGRDTIDFAIAGGQQETIALNPLLGALPAITDSVFIDGFSQNGGCFTEASVEINGGGIAVGSGLTVNCGNTTIAGLAIDNFSGNGIELNNPAGSAGNWVFGCNIGSGLSGRSNTSGNTGDGILITGAGNYVGDPFTGVIQTLLAGGTGGSGVPSGTGVPAGGTMPSGTGVPAGGTTPPGTGGTGGSGTGGGTGTGGFGGPGGAPGFFVGFDTENVISGNTANGVEITGAGAQNNILCGNLIGVDATGLVALANGTNGVSIANGATGNQIGDTTMTGYSVHNVISGNTVNGVLIAGCSNNFVYRDTIGLGADGTKATGNASNGVLVSGSSGNNLIDMDTISTNGLNGVWFSGPNASGNKIYRSAIGTDSTGMSEEGNVLDGVLIDGASNIVGGTGLGNQISGNQEHGLNINGTLNQVYGNFIGTNATGTAALGNARVGVVVAGASNFIGSSAPGTNNVISGNLGDGVFLSGTLNKLYGNWIGTNSTGTAALPNRSNGVEVSGANNYIGSSTLGTSNTISGNIQDGIAIVANTNYVIGNVIGTNAWGTAAIGNGGNGISIIGNSNRIGDATLGGVNLISGNGAAGVLITGNSNLVYGNTIGTNRNEDTALANGTNGVTVNGSNNWVGVSGAIVPNLISGNKNDGVFITGSSNYVYGDWIGTDAYGMFAIANANNGVEIVGNNNEVGNALNGGGNVISGNGNDGVLIQGNVDQVAGNWIGIGNYGAIANLQNGLEIRGSNNIIGLAGKGLNVISGNGVLGISLSGSTNIIADNYIGVGADGKTVVGNAKSGIRILSGAGNIIGGEGAADTRNVISGNGSYGIYITGATGTLIEGNYIGLGADGMLGTYNMKSLGNGFSGILVERGTVIGGAVGTVVGGANASDRNYICNNGWTIGGGFGVELGVGTTNCTVQNNAIGKYLNGLNQLIVAGNASGWKSDVGVGNTWTADNDHD